jgi:hypothetical protein
LITHRGAIGQARSIQESTGCKILIQEQEAYLLPGLDVTSFPDDLLTPFGTAIWTPGHSPGSACFYYHLNGGVLFSGVIYCQTLKEKSCRCGQQKLFIGLVKSKVSKISLSVFSPTTLQFICPGANIGFCGQGFVDEAYKRLAALDLETSY